MVDSASRPNDGREPVFLALGSNLGRRRVWIEQARQILARRGVGMVRCSSLYDTAPREVVDQPRFLNQVCQVECPLPPLRLLEICLQVEQKLGRSRGKDKGPRNIDIDVIYYGERIIDHSRLKLPHPRLQERAFVLAPLAEIAPQFADPRTGLTAPQMLREPGVADETLQPLS